MDSVSPGPAEASSSTRSHDIDEVDDAHSNPASVEDEQAGPSAEPEGTGGEWDDWDDDEEEHDGRRTMKSVRDTVTGTNLVSPCTGTEAAIGDPPPTPQACNSGRTRPS